MKKFLLSLMIVVFSFTAAVAANLEDPPPHLCWWRTDHIHDTYPTAASEPWGIAVAPGPSAAIGDSIYVTNGFNTPLTKYSNRGGISAAYWSWRQYPDSPPTPTFWYPMGIKVDPAGNVYVIDSNRINKFNSNLNYLSSSPAGPAIGGGGPMGLALGGTPPEMPDLPDFFVSYGTNITEDSNPNWRAVTKFDGTPHDPVTGAIIPPNGSAIFLIGPHGTADGEFAPGFSIMDLARDPRGGGGIAVLDPGNCRVQKFRGGGAQGGLFYFQFGSCGDGEGQFSRGGMSGITVDSVGNIYVVDMYACRIQKFDQDGNFRTQWGGSCETVGARPRSIATGPAGDVYVLYTNNGGVHRFRNNDAPVANAGVDLSVPVGMTVFLDGSGSYDANSDGLTWHWGLTSKPVNSSAYISNSGEKIASLFPDLPGTYGVQLVVNDGYLNSIIPATIEILVYDTQSWAIAEVSRIQDAVIAIPIDSLRKANMQNPLSNKLNAVIASISAGLYANALDQLKKDLLGKTDGCATTGIPDKNDWIMTCPEQNKIYPLILETIWIVEGLLP